MYAILILIKSPKGWINLLHVWHHFSFKHHLPCWPSTHKEENKISTPFKLYSAYSGIGVIYSGICTTYVLIICLVHWLSISYKYLTQYTWCKYNNTVQFAPYVKMSVSVSVTAYIFTRLGWKQSCPGVHCVRELLSV